jgi:pilus assembly protein CpaE
MEGKIKVLIVDDIQATRENICKLLEFHPEIVPVGHAGTGEEGIKKAQELHPDVILMDINMPGMDGIEATRILTTKVPQASIIIMSVQGEQEYLRKAMVAGAKDYLTKPFTGQELQQAVKQVHESEQKRRRMVNADTENIAKSGKIITVFSTKGGIGKTTIATNLAVALAERVGARVGVLDADLQFGDVALFLNITPHATIADLVKDMDNLDEKVLEGYLTGYHSNVKVLAAPLRPEQAEMVQAAQLGAVLKVMKTMFQYIVVDTAPTFNETMLSVMDAADIVLVVTSMELPTIKNVKLCLEILDSLNYAKDKIKLVLNRADSDGGIELSEVEDSLHYRFTSTLPSDGKTVVRSVNKGIPFVVGSPEAQVSKDMVQLAKILAGEEQITVKEPKGMVSKFRRLFA